MQITYEVGVDEAGRGPLAGPVAVGAAMVPSDFDWNLIPGVADSKKLSHKNREAIFVRTNALQKEGAVRFSVALVGPRIIDRIGISAAIRLSMRRVFHRLSAAPENVHVKLDGLLVAPEVYVHQETIIKGDQKEKIIGLASIMAKVTRDRYMERMAKKYPSYGFEIHKGYGTKAHRAAIKKLGHTHLHRVTFCRNI